MSRAFLDRNNQNEANSNDSHTSQQKVDFEAQMKKLDLYINNPGWDTADVSPAQMFAEEEEEEKQAKANEEEELQMKPEEEEELQKKENPNNPGTKTTMPDDVRSKMENSFGEDFSDVNIHKDSENAPSLSSLAYTQGNDIHFAPGQYDPASQKGQELLGHELSHVVQQREGRVKPDRQQNKADANVNTDERLEKEADEQGKQATQGKMAGVKGKGSGVQREKGTSNLEERLKEIEGNQDEGTLHAVLYDVFEDTATGTPQVTNVQKVVSYNKEDWKTILSNGVENAFEDIHGFLHAANHGLENKDYPNLSEVNVYPVFENWRGGTKPAYSHLYDSEEKLENGIDSFLLALYSQDSNNSTVDLPQEYVNERGEKREKDFFPELAEFISKHQSRLIRDVSSNEEDSGVLSNGIRTLAEEATPAGRYSSGDPAVARSMIYSAFASAISAAKFVIGSAFDNPDNIGEGFTIVRNSRRIIESVLKSHKDLSTELNSNRKNDFNAAWNSITVNNPLAKAIVGMLRVEALSQFNKIFQDSQGGTIYGCKDEFRNKFKNVIKEAQDELEKKKSDIPEDTYSLLINQVLVQTLINAFEIRI